MLIYVLIFFKLSITSNLSFVFHENGEITLTDCRPLLPTSGSIVYHPSIWPPGAAAPKASAEHPSDAIFYWRTELCGGKDIVTLINEKRSTPSSSSRVLERALWAWKTLKDSKNPSDFHLSFADRSQYCSGCEGVLRLTRLRNCNINEPPLRASSGDFLFSLASALGPDELWVTLEGAEFHVLPALHVGKCTYILPFAVTIPGLYRLHAYAFRADYAALDEIKYADRYPPLTLDSIMGDKLLIQLGSTLLLISLMLAMK